MRKNTVLEGMACILTATAVFLVILTASIGLPIYIRPFYYAHIDGMNLPQISGFEREQIRDAYDEVLDYLTLPGKEFGTGSLIHSPEGKAHFEDCKVLFDLNISVLLASGIILAVMRLLQKRWGSYRLGSHSAAWYGAVTALTLPVVLGSLAALDFDKAFVIFHSIFFPGKTNWVFDYRTDPIILVMPQEFFMHCGMLICAGVLILSGTILIWERKRLQREKKDIT